MSKICFLFTDAGSKRMSPREIKPSSSGQPSQSAQPVQAERRSLLDRRNTRRHLQLPARNICFIHVFSEWSAPKSQAVVHMHISRDHLTGVQTAPTLAPRKSSPTRKVYLLCAHGVQGLLAESAEDDSSYSERQIHNFVGHTLYIYIYIYI